MSWTYKALRATKPAPFAPPGSKEKKPTLLPNAQTQLHSRVVRTVTLGDIAQLYTDFEGTTVDSFVRPFQFTTKQSRSSASSQKVIGS